MNQLTSPESLELSLGSMFAKELTSHACPHTMQHLCSELHQVLAPNLSQYIAAQAQRAAASRKQGARCVSHRVSSAIYAAVSLLVRISSKAALAADTPDVPLWLSESTALANLWAVSSEFPGFFRLLAARKDLTGVYPRALATSWLAHTGGPTGASSGTPAQLEHSSSSSCALVQQQAWEALVACSSRSATAGAAAKEPTLAKVLLHGLGVVWRDLRLRRLSLRNAPADWGAEPSTFLSILPSLAVLNLTGLDTRLDESFSSLSFPSFKVEVVRGSTPNLSVAVHAKGPEELSSVMTCLSTAFSKKRSNTPSSSGNDSSLTPPQGQAVHKRSEPPNSRVSSHHAARQFSSGSCQDGHPPPPVVRQQRQSQQHHQQQQQQQRHEQQQEGQPSGRPEACTAASCASIPQTDTCQPSPERTQQPRLSSPLAPSSLGSQDADRTRPKLTSLRFFLKNPGKGFAPLRRLHEIQTSGLRELALHVVYTSDDQASDEEGEDSADEQGTFTGKHKTKKLMAKLGHSHILSALLSSSALRCLRSLSISEELDVQASDSDEDEQEAPSSHDRCMLCPIGIQLLSRLSLTSLHYHGLLASPHPSSFSVLSSLTRLKTLSLGSNDEDSYLPSMGVHCLPSSLTALTLQNMNIGGAPLGHGVQLPGLSHICFKRCRLPSLPALAPAASLEWINFDNCEMGPMYLSDFVHLWPRLSWLEITYVHDDWRLLNHSSDLAALQQMTCLRKLSLITPYEPSLKIKELLQLSTLRLLSLSPGPSASSYSQLLSLSNFRYLAGLEIRLYSDVSHHTDFITTSDTDGSYAAQELHVDLQEALPMTDVLVMVDDEAVDDWGEAGEEPEDNEDDESYDGSSDSSENEESTGEDWSTENEGTE
ncbi:hypothetical protein DUNSADRAFT_5870 [Dunaliella salina]|uniref:Uncharacterized protein n=1 Tax=Dunaliella salina TaxID=3046 RepID=A0ABQ7GPF4_DUNSA|nr:hypothetical protein DUNSADRAFT_5870 [Dunaliella salina]|eukprot:KAF5836484.1 hypothetical protein DUNSADRAFT_5870 [Dunaliella salina]